MPWGIVHGIWYCFEFHTVALRVGTVFVVGWCSVGAWRLALLARCERRWVHPWPRKKSSPADSGPWWGMGKKKGARVSFWAVSLHHTGAQIYRRVPFPVFKMGNDTDRNDKCLVLPRQKALGKRCFRVYEPRYVPKRLLIEFHCNISGWCLCSLCCVYPQETFPFLQSYSFLQSGSKFFDPLFASQQLKHRQTCQLCRRQQLCAIISLIKGLYVCNIRGSAAFITYPQSTNKVWTWKVVKMGLLYQHRNKSCPKSERLCLLITATTKMLLSVFYLGCPSYN